MNADGQTVYPTHQCFNDALEFFEELAKEKNPVLRMSGYLFLVHGVCLTPEGESYSHAWIEQGHATVIFKGILHGKAQYFATPKEQYYDEMRVTPDVTRYTPTEALKENLASNHFGPWIQRYRDLCNDVKKA